MLQTSRLAHINPDFIARLNSGLQLLQVTATPQQLRQVRKLCASKNPDDVYKYKISPLVIAQFTRRGALLFNNPTAPLGLKRSEAYREAQDIYYGTVGDFRDELGMIAAEIFGGRLHALRLDFRDAPAGTGQRDTMIYHVDGSEDYTPQTQWTVANLANFLIQGDDAGDAAPGECNICTRVINDNELSEKAMDELGTPDYDLNQVHYSNSIKDRAALESMVGAKNIWQLPANSIALTFTWRTLHETAINTGKRPQQRSFGRAIFRGAKP